MANGKGDQRIPATIKKVEDAIASLTDAESKKLQSYAVWCVRKIGMAAAGRDWLDLLNEAFSATLEGRRSWPKADVEFTFFLFGVMRSTSSNWAKQVKTEKRQEALLDSQITYESSDGTHISPIDTAKSPNPDPEKIVSSKALILEVQKIFKDDELVLEIDRRLDHRDFFEVAFGQDFLHSL